LAYLNLRRKCGTFLSQKNIFFRGKEKGIPPKHPQYVQKGVQEVRLPEIKKFRKHLLKILQEEKRQILSAPIEDDPKQFLLSEAELTEKMRGKGFTVRSDYHRQQLGFDGATKRYKQYLKIREQNNPNRKGTK
jgi:hypothetical protein